MTVLSLGDATLLVRAASTAAALVAAEIDDALAATIEGMADPA